MRLTEGQVRRRLIRGNAHPTTAKCVIGNPWHFRAMLHRVGVEYRDGSYYLMAAPVAVIRDVLTLGGTIEDNGRPHTADAIDRLKREASDD